MSTLILPLPGEPRVVVVECDASIAWVLARFARFVRFEANRMTDDPELYEDLVQEGEIALWKVEHWRLDLEDRADRTYVRRMVRRRMWRALAAIQRQERLPKGPPELGEHGLGWHPMSLLVGLDHTVQPTPLPD